MKEEKEFKREDGTKYLIQINCYQASRYDEGGLIYDFQVMRKLAGKRKWEHINEHRGYDFKYLSVEEKDEKNKAEYLKHVTINEVQEVAEILWNKNRPSFA